MDARDAKHFWSLKVSGPGDQKKDLWPKDRKSLFAELKEGEKLTDFLKKHDAGQFLLTPAKPARRSIDLPTWACPTNQEPIESSFATPAPGTMTRGLAARSTPSPARCSR